MTTDDLIQRIAISREPVGVWVIRGKVSCHGVGTRRFRELKDIHPDKLAGIYDGEVRPSWIMADILAVKGRGDTDP